MVSSTRLASGVPARLAPETLLRFCREEWAYYDGVPDRNPNRVLPEDVSVTVAVNSFVTRADLLRTVHSGLAKACDPLLPGIPVNADLRTFDADLSEAYELLDRACQAREVGLARATKVLHRKRRGFIPMLDSVVVDAYLDALGRPGTRLTEQEVGIFVMKAIRRDLEEALQDVNKVGLALAEAGTPMTHLRILEVGVWIANERRGYYRTGVNP